MKKITTLLLFAILSSLLSAQIYRKQQAEEIIKGTSLVRYKEGSETPSYIRFNKDMNISIGDINGYTKKLVESENVGLKLEKIQHSTSYNKNETKHIYRYKQTIDGYPLEFSTWIVHVVNDKVVSMNGDIIHNPQVNTSFAISEEYALDKALDHMGAEIYMWENISEEQLLKEIRRNNNATYYPKGEKVIVPENIDNEDSQLRTAYKFNIFSKKPYDRKEIYVDAQTGKILFDLPLIHVSSAEGVAHTKYSGTREIITESREDYFVLEDNTRGNGIKTFNTNNGIETEDANEIIDNDNVWNNTDDEVDEMDKYAVDAHFATASTYDYFFNVHNINSIDDEGFALYSYINYNIKESLGQINNVNAFWSGEYMVYGNGDAASNITPLTTMDICGHEITHGLTTFTANLRYRNESGALNEAFSDIFAASIEFYAVPDVANWTIGEDCGYTMRSMQDPKSYNQPNTYKGSGWYTGNADNGGVHYNGGPMNYWYYLICEGGSGTNDLGNSYNIEGIGIENAEKIAFKLLTEYLTRSSGYSDAYFYGIQATVDIFGDCSEEVKAVTDAFYAIGVASQPFVDEVIADFKANITQDCVKNVQVQFTNLSINGTQFLWDFGDGETSDQLNPRHTYREFGEFDVKLHVSSENCGEDTKLIENYIKLIENGPCPYVMNTSGISTITDCEGIIWGPGGQANESYNSANSSIVIHSPGALNIELTINNFNIIPYYENNCDLSSISFYDGNSIQSPLINSEFYCNENVAPEKITSSGEYITIWYRSLVTSNTSNFEIRFKCTPGMSSVDIYNEFNDVYIAPNPTNGIFKIYNLKESDNYTISVVDISGKMLMNILEINDNLIDCSHLSDGIYYLTLSSIKEQKVIKFIIQK